MSGKKIKRDDLLFPELSYKIIGCAFDVYNSLGSGHHEKYYQRALAEALSAEKLAFRQQTEYPLKYKDKVIGRGFLDFLVDGKIVVEIKKDNRFSKNNIDQVMGYLKMSGLKLAILINFGVPDVKFRRVINFSSKD